MSNVTQIARAMQAVLGPVAERAGRESGFIQREVKLNGASFVQTLVFSWLANPQASYEELAQTAALLGVSITPQGLEQRFTRTAADCLKRVLEAALAQVCSAQPAALPLLARFSGVYLQDSSVVALPDSLQDCWPGCGGSAPSAAALKLQLRWELRSGAWDSLALTAGKANDQVAAVQQLALPPGALRLADLGYWSLPRLQEIGAAGAYWLSRLQPGTQVLRLSGAPLDLPHYLAAQTIDEFELEVQLGAAQRLPCRLLAQRVPAVVAEQRRRKLRRHASKHGRTPSQAQLALCAWTLLVTNVPSARLSLAEALVLLRVRWQIELLFKHWKSVGQLAASRSAKAERRLCEVYAKLLGLLLEHWCLLCGTWDYPARSLTKAARLVRKHALHLASVLRQWRGLCRVLRLLGRSVSVGCKINKRKDRPATFQRLQQVTGGLG